MRKRLSTRFLNTIADSVPGIFAFLTLSALMTSAYGQDLKTRKHDQNSSPSTRLPSAIQNQVLALGTRMRIAGKEETVLDAQFVDDVGNRKTIRVIHQIGGMARIEGLHEKSAVTFDGEFTYGVSDRTDDVLLDTFVLDTTEGMFYSLQRGASMVLLGHDFQMDSQPSSEIKRPRYDIYLVTAPDRLRRVNLLQSRRFYFDSASGLLASSRYTDSAGVNIETRFLNWKYIEESAYPTIIERYENGRLTFSVTVTRLAGRSPHNAESFQKGVDSLD
jgi:hypothetical protein